MQKIILKNKTIFVTGSAGFIGSSLVNELLRTQSPINIVGIDNMNDYYDVSIKDGVLLREEQKMEINTHKRNIIDNKQKLKEYLNVELNQYMKPGLKSFFLFGEKAILRRHQYLLRKTEYYTNTGSKFAGAIL